jgi:hypothetical protein
VGVRRAIFGTECAS